MPFFGGINENPATSAGLNNTGYLVGIDRNIELLLTGSIRADGLTRTNCKKS